MIQRSQVWSLVATSVWNDILRTSCEWPHIKSNTVSENVNFIINFQRCFDNILVAKVPCKWTLHQSTLKNPLINIHETLKWITVLWRQHLDNDNSFNTTIHNSDSVHIYMKSSALLFSKFCYISLVKYSAHVISSMSHCFKCGLLGWMR